MVYDPDRMFSTQKIHDVYTPGEGQMFDDYGKAETAQKAAVDALNKRLEPPDVAPTQAADSPPPGGFFDEGTARQINLTEVENRFFGELLGNEANRADLLEWVPSLKIEDGQLSVTREHAEGLWKFIEDLVVSDGPGSVPPRLKKEKFWDTLMGEQEYEWSSTYDKSGQTVPPSWVGGD